ncbi:hypothetical protein F5X96DRAFT_631975 [Biscogniauxia mediterranea]|nr:hypothetical protein F5X96DRAFT_631975 [Biscogniauxia mediterranea]
MKDLGASSHGEKSAFTNAQPQKFSLLPEVDTRTHSTLEPVKLDYSTLEPIEKANDPSQNNADHGPVPLADDQPEPKPAPWWKRHLIVIVVGIIIVIGAIIGGVVGGLRSQGDYNSTAASATRTTSTASTPTATGTITAAPSPSNDVWIGKLYDPATNTTENMAFEVTGASDAQCHYQTIVPDDETPCDHPFTLENGITYTWRGCGENTWLEYGGDDIFLGNCDYSAHEWTCGGDTVNAQWICGLGR